AASLGFGLVYFLQRKGWPYHSYPMMVFALLAFGCAMTPGDDHAAPARGRLAGPAAALAAVFMLSMVWFNDALDARPLQAAVARLGQHPPLLSISGKSGNGTPARRA